MTTGWERYLTVVRRIPPGRVATYGTVAALAGSPRAARQVGYALAASGDSDVPWHRVVGRRGRGVGLSVTGEARILQTVLLGDENIAVDDTGVIDPAAEWFGDDEAPAS